MVNHRIITRMIVLLMICIVTVVGADKDQRKKEVLYFDRTVAPILSGYCIDCHSGVKPKGKLDLSRYKSAMAGGESGVVIKPGKVEESLLWEAIDLEDMPPKHPLPDAEKQILRDWIVKGAKWGTDPIDPFSVSSSKRAGYDWWSLQELKAVGIPSVQNDQFIKNDIDRFIVAKLESKGILPTPRADPRTLVRRLYYNLTGLPAPLDVIERFTKHPTDKAWGVIVDDLLGSKEYGEHWARHWLDVARFGESGGFEYNTPRESSWHYRDWVIRSLNDDLPYDAFVRMQIAGDIIKPGTVEGAAAVGFLVAGVHNEVVGQSVKMKLSARQDELEEIVGTVGQTFLGMTVNCARCHDHKFDPISAKEYYQFIAALDGINHGEKKVIDHDSVNAGKLAQLRDRKAEFYKALVDQVMSRGGELATSANIVVTKEAIDVNEKGVKYRVSLKVAPTVWAGPLQATKEGDGVIVRIVKEDKQVLVSRYIKSKGWEKGTNAFKFGVNGFTYEGDGEGKVRIEVLPYPLGSERFGGAIDDIMIRDEKRVIFKNGFDQLKHTNAPGKQADTNLNVYFKSTSEDWSHFGNHAIHAVEHAPKNYALQLYGGRLNGNGIQAVTDREKEIELQLVKLDKEISELSEQISTTVFTLLSGQPGAMRVHDRGDVSQLGEEIAPGGLKAIRGHESAFGIAKNASDVQRRMKLAAWISAPENSLFHRVIVNRVWHYHFGRGLVDSPNDFGFNGGRVSHRELLDWLAVRFKANGYSLKKLHRLIVTSATYQQSSAAEMNLTRAAAEEVDEGNRLLWRQNGKRLSAEMLRDSMLAISGALNRKQYGPGFKDVRVDRVPPAFYYIAIDPVGEEFNRRTIYRWQVRGERSSLLETFDCPDPSVTTPRRTITTTPSQALSQWNHPFVLRMSKHLGERTVKEVGLDASKQVVSIYGAVLGRRPDAEELRLGKAFVSQYSLDLFARIMFNSNEFIWIE